MPALVAGIHVLLLAAIKTWMAGTSPAMTSGEHGAISPDHVLALLSGLSRPSAAAAGVSLRRAAARGSTHIDPAARRAWLRRNVGRLPRKTSGRDRLGCIRLFARRL